MYGTACQFNITNVPCLCIELLDKFILVIVHVCVCVFGSSWFFTQCDLYAEKVGLALAIPPTSRGGPERSPYG